MTMSRMSRSLKLAVYAFALLLAGCSASLLPKPPPQPELFTLDGGAPADAPTRPAGSAIGPTLVVATPRAAAGYDSTQMVYQRRAQEVEHFAYARWVDTPAQMLAPLIVDALQRSAAFAAVVQAPTSAATDLRLDTEVIRLQHDFSVVPSRVRLTLRAVLLDAARHRVLATRDFDLDEDAASADPYGGVVAAQRAVQRMLAQLSAFCAASI